MSEPGKDVNDTRQETFEEMFEREAQAFYQKHGKSPKMMLMGWGEYEELCREFLPTKGTLPPLDSGHLCVEAVVTKLGQIKIICDPDHKRRRTYLVDNGHSIDSMTIREQKNRDAGGDVVTISKYGGPF